jgi:CSLREA domain-containing protein
MKPLELLSCVAMGAMLTACPATGPVFVVNTTADSSDANPGDGTCADSQGKCSLRAAVEEANQARNAEVRLTSGETYALDTSRGSLLINKDMTITGAYASNGSSSPDLPNAVITPRGRSRIFDVGDRSNTASPASVVLTTRNLTLQGVRMPTGVGGANAGGVAFIRLGATFQGENINALDNEAERGAAFANGGTLRIRGGNLWKNRCNQTQVTRGGAILNSGVLELEDVSFLENTCDTGAAIHSDGGSVVIVGGTFANNRAYHGGAAITSSNATVDIAESTIFENNQAPDASRPTGTSAGALNFTAWDRSFIQLASAPNAERGGQLFQSCTSCHSRPSDPASLYTFSLINPRKYTDQALAAKIRSDMSPHFPGACNGDAAAAQCSVDIAAYLRRNASAPSAGLLYGDSPKVVLSDSIVANNFGYDSLSKNCNISGMTFDAASTGNILEELGNSTCKASLPANNTQVRDLPTDEWVITYADSRTGTVVPSLCAGQTPPAPSLFPKYSPECWGEFTFTNAPVVAKCADERGVDCRDSRAWQ